MPPLILPERIRTPADIVRFFMYLNKVDRTSFHPDDRFFSEGEVQYSTRRGEPAYTPEEAQLRDRLMDEVWEVATRHNLDPSEVAIWVTGTDEPVPPWVEKAMAMEPSRKAWNPRKEEGSELGALPPARQFFRTGALMFDVLRPKGLVTEIRVTARGSTVPLTVTPEPRLQQVERTLQRVLEDLYVMARDPEKIRKLIVMTDMPPEQAQATDRMIRWAEAHRPQIIEAMSVAMPAVLPFQRVP